MKIKKRTGLNLDSTNYCGSNKSAQENGTLAMFNNQVERVLDFEQIARCDVDELNIILAQIKEEEFDDEMDDEGIFDESDDEFLEDEMDEDDSIDDVDIELALRNMDEEQLAKCDAAFDELKKAIHKYEEYEKTLDDDDEE